MKFSEGVGLFFAALAPIAPLLAVMAMVLLAIAFMPGTCP